MSSHVAKAFLEHDLMYQFHDLLEMIEAQDERFYWFNDIYFMTVCQEVRFKNRVRDPRVRELNEMLLYRHPPKTVRHPLFAHRIIKAEEGDSPEKKKLVAQIRTTVADFEKTLQKHGTGKEWLLADIPEKDVVFTRGLGQIVKKRASDNLYRERDPIKVVHKNGKPSLLVELDNTLMKHMSGFINFVPTVYANDSALNLLRARGKLKD